MKHARFSLSSLRMLLGAALVVSLGSFDLGCKQISDLTTISKDFPIDVTRDLVAAGPTTTFSQVDSVDLTQTSSDFAKYKDNITGLVLDSAWYEVTSAPTPTTLIINSATYSVVNPSGGAPTMFASASNVHVQQDFTAGGEHSMTVDPTGATTVSNLLKNSPYSAHFILSGTVNQAPFGFQVRLHLRFKMTASISA